MVETLDTDIGTYKSLLKAIFGLFYDEYFALYGS